jgi:hypothetical protein
MSSGDLFEEIVLRGHPLNAGETNLHLHPDGYEGTTLMSVVHHAGLDLALVAWMVLDGGAP